MAELGDQPDALVWKLAQNGDHLAFGELFARHNSRVYNYCFRRIGSWSSAEEALSIVFMETWRRRDDVQVIEETLLPWLFSVANFVIRNLDRSRRRYESLLLAAPELEFVSDHADDVAARVDDERQMKKVLRQLAKLRRIDQDVIAMCDWEGLSTEEAAAALAIPPGTVKSRLFRARGRLRQLLAEGDALSATDPGGTPR